MHYAIRKRIVEATPLLPGNAVKVLTDEEYSGRITVFGYPNDSSVYYVTEELKSDFSLVAAYESEVYEDADRLPDGFGSLADITETFFR